MDRKNLGSRRSGSIARLIVVVAIAFYGWTLFGSLRGGAGLSSAATAYEYQYGKVTMCHKNKKTISVDQDAVPAHLAQGDTIGPCH